MINSLGQNYQSYNLNPNLSSQNKSLNSNSQSINQNLVSDKSAAVSEILGFGVDKDGYFTSDLNEAAGLPKDYKIHSSSIESLIKVSVHPHTSPEAIVTKAFRNIDIAKTLNNAYKILTQVVDENILNSKSSFSPEEIANFPQAYEYDRQSMQVFKVHNTKNDYMSADAKFNYNNSTNTKINRLFFDNNNIFNSNNNGNENIDSGVFFNTHKEKYINSDRSISKGGLLIAIINENLFTREGETTRVGKAQGFDKNMNETQVKAAWADGLKLKPAAKNSTLIQGFGFLNKNAKEELEEYLKNYKDPVTLTFEAIDKMRKEELERLKQRKQKVDIRI